MGEYKIRGGEFHKLYEKMLYENHVLIAGATGSGKSTVINGMIHTIMVKHCPGIIKHPDSASIILCDPKYGVELGKYKNIPHCIGYADNVKEILHQLERASNIMEKRYQDMRNRGLSEWDGGHVYVFIDEYADLVLNLKESELKVVQHLLELGRAAHVHCIIATQWPSRKCITAAVKVNCTCALALRCDTEIESKQIINVAGAEKLPQYGVGILKTPKIHCEKHRVPLVSDAEIQEQIEWWVKQR